MALPHHFWNLHQLLEPKVSYGRKVHSSAKGSGALELQASLFFTFLQSLICNFEAGREGLEAHIIQDKRKKFHHEFIYPHNAFFSCFSNNS